MKSRGHSDAPAQTCDAELKEDRKGGRKMKEGEKEEKKKKERSEETEEGWGKKKRKRGTKRRDNRTGKKQNLKKVKGPYCSHPPVSNCEFFYVLHIIKLATLFHPNTAQSFWRNFQWVRSFCEVLISKCGCTRAPQSLADAAASRF